MGDRRCLRVDVNNVGGNALLVRIFFGFGAIPGNGDKAGG